MSTVDSDCMFDVRLAEAILLLDSLDLVGWSKQGYQNTLAAWQNTLVTDHSATEQAHATARSSGKEWLNLTNMKLT